MELLPLAPTPTLELSASTLISTPTPTTSTPIQSLPEEPPPPLLSVHLPAFDDENDSKKDSKKTNRNESELTISPPSKRVCLLSSPSADALSVAATTASSDAPASVDNASSVSGPAEFLDRIQEQDLIPLDWKLSLQSSSATASSSFSAGTTASSSFSAGTTASSSFAGTTASFSSSSATTVASFSSSSNFECAKISWYYLHKCPYIKLERLNYNCLKAIFLDNADTLWKRLSLTRFYDPKRLISYVNQQMNKKNRFQTHFLNFTQRFSNNPFRRLIALLIVFLDLFSSHQVQLEKSKPIKCIPQGVFRHLQDSKQYLPAKESTPGERRIRVLDNLLRIVGWTVNKTTLALECVCLIASRFFNLIMESKHEFNKKSQAFKHCYCLLLEEVLVEMIDVLELELVEGDVSHLEF